MGCGCKSKSQSQNQAAAQQSKIAAARKAQLREQAAKEAARANAK